MRALSAYERLRLFLVIGFSEHGPAWAKFIPRDPRAHARANTEISMFKVKPEGVQNVNLEFLGLLLHPYNVHKEKRQ